jgi:Flp pilus assembly protein TadD
MSGGQLLSAARTAMNSGNNSRAAALAKKAIAKGAGGSAHYVLGAAYQMMGASMGARNEYAACAKSGAPEASECAALVDTMSPKTESTVKDPKSW